MELPPKKNIDDSFFNMENCYKISVHLSKDDLIFDRGTYDKDILKNDISKQDYDNIINEAEKIILLDDDCNSLLTFKASQSSYVTQKKPYSLRPA